jgi:uncharacterized protein YabN with tetrapyrrole methylase and pyrophosphatase domain
VGTGIRLGQITPEAEGAIKAADVVFALIGDPAVLAHLLSIGKQIENLLPYYQVGRPRTESYAAMVEILLTAVRSGKGVCFALYGHPGVLAVPAKLAIEGARLEGFVATMQPGISAEACMLAELGIDPGDCGIQSHESSGFLLYKKTWDPTAYLVLWQIGLVADPGFHLDYPNKGIGNLMSKLLAVCPPEHEVVLYEAATMPLASSRVERLPLRALAEANLNAATTLLVPPSRQQEWSDELSQELLGE